MMRLTAFTLAVLATLGTSIAQEAPGQEPPALALTASFDRAPAKYTLPEEMQIEVRLENTSDKDVEVNELTYDASSLSFVVKPEWTGGGGKEYALSIVHPDPLVESRLTPSRVTLGPKKVLTYVRRFPTLGPGRFTFTAHYDSGKGGVAAAPITAEVEGSAAGNKLIATVTTAQQGTFWFELKPQEAPANVSNFVELARRGFYNDMLVHSVVPRSWIRTGCPYGLGVGGPGYSLKAEVDQTAVHEEGTVSMSGGQKSGYNGSQFFICLSKQPGLDKKYTIIGKVPADQMEPVKAIGKVTIDRNTERPLTDVKITSVTISVKN